MASWISDGLVSGFNVVSGVGALRAGVGRLASAGSVNTQMITRLHHNVTYTLNKADRMTATVQFRYVIGDGETNPPAYNGGWSAAMFVVAHGSIPGLPPGTNPTPAQILSAGSAVKVYRGSRTGGSGNGMDTYYSFSGPRAGDLSPNTRYWLMIMPTMIKANSTPSLTNDIIINPGQQNTLGRAISFWTNRPPAKPAIVSPSPGAVIAPNALVNLQITSSDPDAVAGGNTMDYRGLNGVQVQYAAQPTEANPAPVWTDLQVYTYVGIQPGWYIDGVPGSPWGVNNLTDPTAYLPIRAAVTPTLPAAEPRGYLPSGNWQLRVRTFESGNPYTYERSNVRPISGFDTAYTPSTYPATNTSAWSDAVFVSIPAQVPPPVPISPRNSSAVQLMPAGEPIRLRWQYKNTASPPFPQKAYSLQLRRVGAETWFTFASTSANAYVDMNNVGLGEWEWRVQVTDTNDKVSNYSEIAVFWVVPPPSSGGVRPLPASTVDGATLGCGTHRVFVFRRGGQRRVAEITHMVHVDWSRLRDDISTAQIVIAGWDVDCGNLLSKLKTWAYEIVIFRNNGYSTDRVWEGPITLLTYERERVVINAKDVMAYAYRRILKQAMNDNVVGAPVTDRARRVLQNALAPDDPNLLAYLTVLSQDSDAMQYRSTPAFARTAFEEVDDMAANAGLDYTALGRAILLWGTKHRIGTLPEFRDEDLGSSPIVSEYGMSMANVYSVSDGNGIHGEATRLDAFGKDAIYGLVEMLSSTWASDAPSDTGTYTQAGLATMIESFKGFAEKSIADRYLPGAPVVVRVPDNTTLNPSLPLSIQQLVPGVAVPLRSVSTLRKVVGIQKLDSIKVTEEKGEETISITLSPFSREDAIEEEEAGA